MKNTMQKALIVCLLAAVSLSAFGCSKNEPALPVETISLEQTKQDLTFDFKTGVVNETLLAQDNKEEPKDEDTTESTDKAAATENNSDKTAATTVEEVTQVVNVTDAEGHGVTDAAGEAVTDVAVVDTRVIEVPLSTVPAAADGETTPTADGNDTPADGNDDPAIEETVPPQEGTASDYTPAYDTCKAYWLDMSKAGDYTFNGEFLTFTFAINADIPDGNYPLTISKTDIASWEEVRYYPQIINGEIAVNTPVTEQEDMSATDFSLKVNSQAAKQGQNVTVTIDLANNPGFCGFVLDLQYDSNAMTIVEAGAGSDYDEAVHINN